MHRGIWQGDVSFGLVYIPVTLYSAESHQCDVKLHLLDKRNLAPIGYQKINKVTGQKVPSDQIVEGYEYEDHSYVILSKLELAKIRLKSTQSIEILEFVDAADIPLEYYERPYYLEPLAKGEHGYALLREVLRRTHKVGIAKVIIKTRQYLAALSVEKNIIMLELLRFPCELVDQAQFKIPVATHKIEAKEIKIAETLVKGMTAKWNPKKYKNEYQGSLLDMVMEKIKLGESYEIAEQETKKQTAEKGKIIDIMELLKKSVAKTKKRPAAKRASRKKLAKGR